MATEEALIKFKTDAWKSTGMVAGYAERMHENRGTNRLKNHVEVDLCRDNVAGRRILDVGIGTGRATLPLARDGYDVTGIDISQAMLDQCRREAGEIPIDLAVGDLTNLPLGDEQFDTLVSLNVAVHFPNWREALKDWARVVKPGGRLVFDVHSRDHLNAVGALRGCDPDELLTPAQRNDPGHFVLRITADEVAQAATENGLCVVRLVPYAALLGGGNVNYWLNGSRLYGYPGDRAMSWMAVDDRLFQFGAFIEQTVTSRLSTHATGRFMIVLEKREDPGTTKEVLRYNESVGAALRNAPRLASLQAAIGADVASWPEQLQMHLAHAQNVTLLAMALSSPAALHLRGLIEDLTGPDMASRIYDGNERQRVDDLLYETVRSWHADGDTAKHLQYKGIDLGPALEYDMMHDLLQRDYFAGAEKQ